MKLAIISDIHENFHNLILALQEMEQHDVSQIICLGDLMNTGIAKLLAAQSIPTHLVWGNNDGEKVEITLAATQKESIDVFTLTGLLKRIGLMLVGKYPHPKIQLFESSTQESHASPEAQPEDLSQEL